MTDAAPAARPAVGGPGFGVAGGLAGGVAGGVAASDGLVDIAGFDALPAPAACDLLRAACASEAWLDAVVGRRPFANLAELREASDDVLAKLPWADVEQALEAHPRIGERATGVEQEAAWSREEQAGVTTAADDTAEALRRGNLDYERRFGHVFLICATGRSAQQMLAALYERLDNEPAAEHAVVRDELSAIVRLRMARVLG